MKTAEKLEKNNRFSPEYTWQKITRMHLKITRSLGQSKNYYAWH